VSVSVDANILVYASNDIDPAHDVAAALMSRLAEGPDIVYMFWPTILGYLRIVTHPSILPHPTPNEATANIQRLIERPHIRSVGESDGFWSLSGLGRTGSRRQCAGRAFIA
jgi:predicted nucleic acid-binding protein